MACTVESGDLVRKRAEWMRPVDDKLLEKLRDEGKMMPVEYDDAGIADSTYASNRLSLLERYGLVKRLRIGLYVISEAGEQYLDEKLDASNLESSDE